MKKGFTLIELLAVILILGIIALIAIPKVTDVIEDAKKGAAETSAENYITAVGDTIALQGLKGNEVEDGTKNVGDIDANIKGEGPTSGTFVVQNGSIKSADLVVNGYNVHCDNKGKCTATKVTTSYVYFQLKAEFTSIDQTTPTISTDYNAYLKIDSNDITKVQACFNDNGTELCLNPNEYAISKQKTLDHFEYDANIWTQQSETKWTNDDRICDIEVVESWGTMTSCSNSSVSTGIASDGGVGAKDESTGLYCYVNTNGSALCMEL